MAIKDHQHHTPREVDIPGIEQLRKWFALTDSVIRQVCPEGRDASVALTHLETSRMWAIKSLAMLGQAHSLIGFEDDDENEATPGEQEPVLPVDSEHPDFKERRQQQGVTTPAAYSATQEGMPAEYD